MWWAYLPLRISVKPAEYHDNLHKVAAGLRDSFPTFEHLPRAWLAG